MEVVECSHATYLFDWRNNADHPIIVFLEIISVYLLFPDQPTIICLSTLLYYEHRKDCMTEKPREPTSLALAFE